MFNYSVATWCWGFLPMAWVPAPPALWLCVCEIALWRPVFAQPLWSCSGVSLPPSGPHRAASPDSHTDFVTAPCRPAESTHTTHRWKKMLTKKGQRSKWCVDLCSFPNIYDQKQTANNFATSLKDLRWPEGKAHLQYFNLYLELRKCSHKTIVLWCT